MRRSVIPWVFLLAAACQDKMWPDEPHVRRTSTKGGVTFSVSVPEGFGNYQDSRGIIWRSADMDWAVYVKVYLTSMPKSLAEAAQEPAFEKTDRLIVKEKTADGYRVILRNGKTGRERTWLWKRRGRHTVYCHSLWILRDPKPEVVARYNRWMRARCESLRIAP